MENMQNATIVRLAPSTTQVSVVSFEEAFGEHSEFRGRGRARRQERRQKRRMTRIANRGERKRARQGIRNEQQEARQDRKDIRKTRRVARKAIGDEEEETAPEQETEQTEEGYAEDSAETSEDEYATPETQEEGSAEEYDFENGESAEGSESFDGEDSSEAFDGEDSSEARGGRARRQARRSARKEKRAARRNPPPPPEDAAEEAESFDGDADSNQFTSDATGSSIKVEPSIQDLTKRIVWNKEAIRRHKLKKDRLIANSNAIFKSGRNRQNLSKNQALIQAEDLEIQKHQDRLKQLEAKLKTFGSHPHISSGFKQAEMTLQKSKENQTSVQDQQRIKATIVSQSLHPEFGPERIDIPAQSEIRTVELTSGADGKGDAGKAITLGNPKVLLALGVAGLAIWYFGFRKK